MLIKVDEFPSGLEKTKPNNGELEEREGKKSRERRPSTAGREREKSNTDLALRPRLHRIQLKPPPNSMSGKIPKRRAGSGFWCFREAFSRASPACVSPAYRCISCFISSFSLFFSSVFLAGGTFQ
ncbi:hypothetical protein AVEN_102141-1 [Araneus ventricosus]|uniref:Uncharacterized protein n=1 Tax=Araneus ventricosus TaxID=182803 RepID=A0A4Y2LLD4_ARAVE|nr:hypothetical protein AVEN_102141-1 [Araneus ventricosus]